MFFLTILLLVAKVLGDVSITAPKTGQSYSASGGSATVDIKWIDSTDDDDDQFSLSKIKTYTISLCTGPSTAIECFATILKAESLDDTEYQASVKSSLADDGYYFFQIYAVFPDSATTIHYTNRFELTDMTGSTNTLTVKNTDTGTAPPAQTQGVDASSVDSKSFTVPYTAQTGKTRYAPMQLQPGTKADTDGSWSRKFPTSAVTYFSTITPSPKVLSTITPGWSYTITSKANWAAPAPTPSIKYAPKDRVTKASLSSAAKSKRWLD